MLSFWRTPDFEAPADADADGTWEVGVRVSDGVNHTRVMLAIELADVDDTAPALAEATVDAATLTLTFDEALDTTSVPAASAFTVTVAGTVRGVGAVDIDGASAVLTLASAVAANETVTVEYAVPAGANAAKLADGAGNAVVAVPQTQATNETPAPENTAATGAPAITGTAQVGETLTATTAAIDDADGLAGVTFAYQWSAGDGNARTDIDGATAESYTVGPDDVGKTLKITLTFEDDAGHAEQLASEATDAVTAAVPGAPSDLQAETPAGADGALDVTWEAPASDGGAAVTAYRVHWKSGTQSYDTGAESARAAETAARTHTLTGLANGTEVTVEVVAVNTAGAGAGAEAAATPRDRKAPAFTGASADGATLTLGFDETLDENAQAPATAFAVTVEGAARDVDAVAISGTDAVLTLASAVANGETVTVSYTVPSAAGAAKIGDAAGNPAQGLTQVTVANETPAPGNRAPTGAVQITGTAQVGETLSAGTDTIEDADGLESATFAYQWIANDGDADAEIANATNKTYTVAPGDAGKTLKVQVSFDDDAENTERLTSKPTEAVRAAVPSAPTALEAETPAGADGALSVTWHAPASDGGAAVTAYRVHWKSGTQSYDTGAESARAAETTARAHTLTGLANGTEVTIEVVAVNSAGAGAAAETAATPRDRKAPAFTGANADGAKLTLTFDETLDENAQSPASAFAVTVEGAARGVDAVAVQATHVVLTLATALANGESVTLAYAVPGTSAIADAAGNAAGALAEVAVSNETPAPGNRAPTGAVRITGTPHVGETLSAGTETIEDADGLTGATFAYQWLANDGNADATIANATAKTYTVAPDDAGKTLKVRVTFEDDAGTQESLTSAATGTVTAPLTAAFSNAPERHDGASTFTVELHLSEEIEMSYVTVRDTALRIDGGDIKQAQRLAKPSNAHWQLTVEPEGDAAVTITAPADRPCTETRAICTGDGRTLATAVAITIAGPATTNTAATGAPEIAGTPTVGETLEASVAAIEDAQGLANAEFAWQWMAVAGETTIMLSGETQATYTVRAADVGATLQVRVTFDDDAGNAESATSAPTATVTATVPGAAQALEAATPNGSDGVLAVAWEAPASDGGAAITAWRVAWKSGAEDYDTSAGSARAAETSERAHLIAGLVNGTATTIEVRAVNSAGAGDAAEVTATPSDARAPAFVEAAIDGASLTLTFDETLDDDGATAVSAFTVNAGESAQTIESVAVAGAAVTLTLAQAVSSDDTVTVSYTVPAGADAARLADGAGNAAAGLANAAVENKTGAANAAPAGRPSITGTAQVHQTLTASADGITDGDGTENATFAWQWIANDGTADADIETATAPAYTVVAADAGKTLKVRVTFEDDKGTTETLVSEPTETVTAAPAEVSIAPARTPVTEGASASFTLARTGDTSAELTVAVRIGATGAVLASTAPSEATFAAGAAQATVSVASAGDTTGEADGYVTARVGSGTGYTIAAGRGSARVDVLDDDRSGAVTRTVLWSADFTVVDYETGAIGAATADLFANNAGTEGLEGRELWYFTPTRKLKLKVSADIDDVTGATLEIGALSLALAKDSEGSPSFTFDDVDIAWTDAETVSVQLVRTTEAQAPPAGVSVADASAGEAPGATLDFRVTLDAAQTSAVSVRYATSDGTASAGADYVARRGAVRFGAGETAKTVSIEVLDDAHDDTGETMTLTLSAPFGATIADGTATGTITNTDVVPKAWLARFGRTVASHVVDAIGERFAATGESASHVTIAGRRLTFGAGGATAPPDDSTLTLKEEAARWAARTAGAREHPFEDRHGLERDSEDATLVSGRDLLLGSAFVLSSAGDGEGEAGGATTRWTAWGRASESSFDGSAGGVALDGDVTTFTLGADAAHGRWLAGVALAHSTGTGTFRDAPGEDETGAIGAEAAGTIESTLTTVHPYAQADITDRLAVWGILGYGAGELTVSVEDDATWNTGTGFQMAAAGARGVLVKAPETGGFELSLRGDAVVQRMRSDAATGEAGNLAAADARTSQLRLALEGSRAVALEDGGRFAPSLEVGLRQDGGDAETGTGIELGGGLAWADPAHGLTVEAKARTLIAHEDADYREWGASGSVRIEPGASGRGLSLTLAPAWGAAEGGAERLWSLRDARGLAPDAEAPAGSRLEAELGYGFAVFGDRGVATPYAGLSRSETGETLRLGHSLRLGASQWKVEGAFGETERAWGVGYDYRLGQALDLSVEATRREAANDDAPEHGVMLRLGARW